MDEMKIIDRDMIITALLHDSIEDCADLTPELLQHSFGSNVVTMIKVLSKAPKEGYIERLSTYQDWKVLLIKSCDRLDNLRSLMIPGTSLDFKKKQVKETKEKYFPIFDRMVSLIPAEYKANATIIRDEIRRLVERYATIIELQEEKTA